MGSCSRALKLCLWFLLSHGRRAHRAWSEWSCPWRVTNEYHSQRARSAHVCSLPRQKRRDGGGRRRPRERENEIASRHAYEIDGRNDIKVVPSVRRGAIADKWPEMFAKVAGSAWQIIFHPCRTSERMKEGKREKDLSMWRTVSRCQGQVGEKSPLICGVGDRSMRPKIPPRREFIWRV